MTDLEIFLRSQDHIRRALTPPSREDIERSARIIVAATRADGHAVVGCLLLEMYVEALDDNEILRARLELAQKKRKERIP